MCHLERSSCNSLINIIKEFQGFGGPQLLETPVVFLPMFFFGGVFDIVRSLPDSTAEKIEATAAEWTVQGQCSLAYARRRSRSDLCYLELHRRGARSLDVGSLLVAGSSNSLIPIIVSWKNCKIPRKRTNKNSWFFCITQNFHGFSIRSPEIFLIPNDVHL